MADEDEALLASLKQQRVLMKRVIGLAKSMGQPPERKTRSKPSASKYALTQADDSEGSHDTSEEEDEPTTSDEAFIAPEGEVEYYDSPRITVAPRLKKPTRAPTTTTITTTTSRVPPPPAPRKVPVRSESPSLSVISELSTQVPKQPLRRLTRGAPPTRTTTTTTTTSPSLSTATTSIPPRRTTTLQVATPVRKQAGMHTLLNRWGKSCVLMIPN